MEKKRSSAHNYISNRRILIGYFFLLTVAHERFMEDILPLSTVPVLAIVLKILLKTVSLLEMLL